MSKLNCILLVDDDEATNFFHEMVIEQAGIAGKAIAKQSGKEALDFLKEENEGEYPSPDLVFIDINMPGMNGWEFLEAYNQLDEHLRGRKVIVMLTTSLNPDERERAQNLGYINDFMNKPLTEGMLQQIMEKHFPEK